MTERVGRVPGSDHPISVRLSAHRVLVEVGERVVADTRAALVLQEASYPPVQYIPREDADMTLLTRSKHTTYCPYKGDCNYYSIAELGARGVNCVWSYEAPYAAVGEIKGYLAFYADRVKITVFPET